MSFVKTRRTRGRLRKCRSINSITMLITGVGTACVHDPESHRWIHYKSSYYSNATANQASGYSVCSRAPGNRASRKSPLLAQNCDRVRLPIRLERSSFWASTLPLRQDFPHLLTDLFRRKNIGMIILAPQNQGLGISPLTMML